MWELPTNKTKFLFENTQDFNQTTHGRPQDPIVFIHNISLYFNCLGSVKDVFKWSCHSHIMLFPHHITVMYAYQTSVIFFTNKQLQCFFYEFHILQLNVLRKISLCILWKMIFFHNFQNGGKIKMLWSVSIYFLPIFLSFHNLKSW